MKKQKIIAFLTLVPLLTSISPIAFADFASEVNVTWVQKTYGCWWSTTSTMINLNTWWKTSTWSDLLKCSNNFYRNKIELLEGNDIVNMKNIWDGAIIDLWSGDDIVYHGIMDWIYTTNPKIIGWAWYDKLILDKPKSWFKVTWDCSTSCFMNMINSASTNREWHRLVNLNLTWIEELKFSDNKNIYWVPKVEICENNAQKTIYETELNSYIQSGSYLGQCLVWTNVLNPYELKWDIWEIVSDIAATNKVAKVALTEKVPYWELVNDSQVTLEAWIYEIWFKMKTNDISKADVISNIWIIPVNDSSEWFIKEIYWKDFSEANKYENQKIKFRVEKDNTVMTPFVFYGWISSIWIDNISITKLDETYNPNIEAKTYKYEDNVFNSNIWTFESDDTAENKKSVKSIKDTTKKWFLIWGPYTNIDLPWDHKAIFKLKTNDNTTNKIIAKIEVFNTNWDWINKVKYLRWNDFVSANAWQDFSLDYIRTSKWNIEYRVYSYWETELSVDNVVSQWAMDIPVVKEEPKAPVIETPVVETPVVETPKEPEIVTTTDPVTDITSTTKTEEVVSTEPVDPLSWEAEKLPWIMWEIVVDANASGWKYKKTTKWNESWYMQFWPYTDWVTKNAFNTAKFRLKTPNNTSSEVYAVIDVINQNWSGQKVTKKIRWTDFAAANTWQDFDINFFRTNDWVLEFRIYFTWVDEISSDKVNVTLASLTKTTTYESEDLYWVVWTSIVDDTASWKKAIKATVWVDNPGTFQFGPYKTPFINKWSYIAKVRLKTPQNKEAKYIWLIDVFDSETWYREYIEVKATDFIAQDTYQEFEIPFIKPDSWNLEFRVFFYGTQDLYADNVVIEEIVKPKLPDYESENLPWITGRDIVDVDASWKMAREVKVWVDREWAMQFGPYDATNMVDWEAYQAHFQIKVKDNTSSNYIWLIDAFNWDTWLRKYLEIRPTDFDKANQYQDFVINFTKPKWSNNMEYRVFFYWKQDFTIDRVYITEWVSEWLPVFEAERLPSKAWRVIKDDKASGWKIISYDAWLFSENWIQFGPYKIDNVTVWETYKANFVLATTDRTEDIVAFINVYNSIKWIDIRIPIRWVDFDAENTFKTFSMDFDMVDKEAMEFRIYATWKASISSDKIYISK